MSAEVRLDASSIEAVALRVVELLREGDSDIAVAAPELIDAAEVARRFRLSRDYVYDHADDLGAIRVGNGPRPRLRFDPAVVAKRLTPCSDSKGSQATEPRTGQPKTRPRRRRSTGAESQLLPIRPAGRGRA